MAFGDLPHVQYSSHVEIALLFAWIVASAGFAYFARSARTAYAGAAITAVPAIGYSMLGYGLLPMAGFVHVGVAGVYGWILHLILLRWRRSQSVSSIRDAEPFRAPNRARDGDSHVEP